jgi:hypothetical protein
MLAEARQAKERLIEAEDDAAVAREEFRRAVHKLVSHSSPPGGVAAMLGLSGQQLDDVLQGAGAFGEKSRGRTSQIGWSCSFCGKPLRKDHVRIPSQGADICYYWCVDKAFEALGHRPAHTELGEIRSVPERDTQVQCSFCGKHRDQVRKLAGIFIGSLGEPSASAAICSDCLILCLRAKAEAEARARVFGRTE